MASRRAFKRLVLSVAPTVFFSLLTVYFVWNVVHGDHGLRSYEARKAQLARAQAELAMIEAEQHRWERKVAGLKASSLDADVLDESARTRGVGLPDEIVVLIPKKDQWRTQP